MKRQYYAATVVDETGDETAAQTYAMNSAIRKTEALVREAARAAGVMFHGGQPARAGDVYTRRWTGDNGAVLVATARKALDA